MGDRFFDLGNLAVNNDFDATTRRGCSTPTGASRPTPRRLAALRLMRLMSDFREAMWGVVQAVVLRARLRLRRLRRPPLRAPRGAPRRPGLRGLAGALRPRELPDARARA